MWHGLPAELALSGTLGRARPLFFLRRRLFLDINLRRIVRDYETYTFQFHPDPDQLQYIPIPEQYLDN